MMSVRMNEIAQEMLQLLKRQLEVMGSEDVTDPGTAFEYQSIQRRVTELKGELQRML